MAKLTDAQKLRRDLRDWRGKLEDRQHDEVRRVEQTQRARRRAVRHRGDPLYAERYRRSRVRLAGTRRAIHTAQAAITKKRGQLAKLSNRRSDALRWCRANLYKTEHPPGSNCIPWLRHRFGFGCVPWCGLFAANALIDAGVKGVSYRLAAVSLIEDDAKAGKAPFRNWSTDPRSAKPGDLVVLFGRGVHVEVVRAVKNGYLDTYGGNTSSGTAGSQANGGGSYPRSRAFGAVRGIAHVAY